MTQQVPLIALNVERLYNNWAPNQRNNNINANRVNYFVQMLQNKQAIEPIVIEGLTEIQNRIYIRTADGRHRLTAFHQQHKPTIQAVNTLGAQEAKELFDL